MLLVGGAQRRAGSSFVQMSHPRRGWQGCDTASPPREHLGLREQPSLLGREGEIPWETLKMLRWGLQHPKFAPRKKPKKPKIK